MKRALLAGAGLFVLAMAAQPAAAADMPRPVTKAPAMVAAPMFNWTGFYVGVHAGYGWGDSHVSPLNGGEGTDVDGWLAGGQVGFNLQHGNFVWGIEADGAWADIENDAGPGSPPEGYVNVRSLYTVRARGGIAANNTLYYLTGGWAGARVKYIDFDVGPGSLTKSYSGWTVGAGLEYAFAPGWSAKLEYLYADLGDETYNLGTPDKVELDAHIVRVGLNYRFATGGKAPIGKSPAVMTKY